MNHARLYDIMSGDVKGIGPAAARVGLSILSPGYRLAVGIRNKLFDLGIKKSMELDRPVISVGNITTGGTGKTPMVIELARRLIAMDQKPAVLMRGYMAGQSDAPSDEAEELAEALGPGVPVMPNPDRVEGAKRILAEHPETTVFLLDDGFQHRRVKRDLDIVLVDATRPFGFGRLLPRGLLREPIGNLKRADAVIITRCDPQAGSAVTELDQRIEAVTGRPPLAHTHFAWSGFRRDAEELSPTYLDDKQVVGACAIGNPSAFHAMLASAKEVLATHTFDDHHHYTEDEVRALLADAGRRGADAVVITEKDWVKWRPILTSGAMANSTPPVVRPILGIKFLDGDQDITALINRAINE